MSTEPATNSELSTESAAKSAATIVPVAIFAAVTASSDKLFVTILLNVTLHYKIRSSGSKLFTSCLTHE